MEGKCCRTVYPSGIWGSFHGQRCDKPAKIEVNGQLFCGRHDPIKKKKVEDAKMAEWERNRNIRFMNHRKDILLQELGLVLVNLHEDVESLPVKAEYVQDRINEYKDILVKLEAGG